MAISGSAKPSIEMCIKDGELVIGKAAMRQGVVREVDLAVQRLLSGEIVFVQQFGPLCTQVQRTVEMALAKPATEHGQAAGG